MAALDAASRKTLLAGLQVATASQWPDYAAGLDPASAHFNTYGYTISLGEWHPDINAIAVPIDAGRRHLFDELRWPSVQAT